MGRAAAVPGDQDVARQAGQRATVQRVAERNLAEAREVIGGYFH